MRNITLTVSDLLNQAVSSYQVGHLDEAEGLCRAILRVDGNHVEALHLLGVVQSRLGRSKEALASYDRVLVIKPDYAQVLTNRGTALWDLKRFEDALASHDKALAIKPDFAWALYNRGVTLRDLKRLEHALASYDKALAIKPDFAEALNNRGIALEQLKRFEEAAASYDQAIALKPNYADAFYTRGNAHFRLRQFGEAVASYDQALALKPDSAETYSNRGLALCELKRFDEGLASYDRAIALKPDCAEAFINRGLALCELKRFDEALASCNRAIALNPASVEAFNNRGNAFTALKQFEAAVASYDQAIALKPNYAAAFYNRGNALQELRRIEDALASYNQAIALKPDYADAFNSRGVALADLEHYVEAVASYNQAIALKPNYADAFYNRGIALQELKQLDEALASHSQAVLLAPNHKFAFGGLVSSAMQLCDWTRWDELSGELRRRVTERKLCGSPIALLGYNDDAALHLTCAQNYALECFNDIPQRLGLRAIWHNDKIRVAYLSSDFRGHPTAYLAAELFERHDRSHFEVIGVSFGPDDGSDMRARLEAGFDQFIDVRMQSDQDVARLINDLQIDIAVDLNGLTQHGRLGILAFRPAPIQVNYLGFPGTTGVNFIDYIIADAIVLPFDQQPYYTEHIVHLPDCYQVNDRKRMIASRTLTREKFSLPAQGIVFCCFNNNWKITPAIFDVWMRLLRKVAGSVLWLRCDSQHAEQNLCKEAAARGIDPARLVFADPLPLSDHLARHCLADLFLDTLPCNAHTTASDALWAGLPVLTCRGKAFAGRAAASLVTAVGLPELLTDSLEDYEALALRFATDPLLRSGLRERLRKNRLECSLFDTDRFCRHIEAAYTTMWELWQREESPRSFSVAPQTERA